ncbi:DUF2339 domain-containing protein [Dongia rigui]|uniref:DUF2339 domain-containing protein n=1 Tax=Dongia rigui TaxID=940149 RepID=A0ABU5DUS7_9PROT|nr:DUF2339 domain-containing protein [Dongia rigui]MDY0871052.1 DUF2339 domain-containing protein [Dongia rigui]
MDDALEILLGLIGFAVGGFAIFVMPFVSFISWRRGVRLDRELAALRQEVAVLKRGVAAVPVPAPAPEAVVVSVPEVRPDVPLDVPAEIPAAVAVAAVAAVPHVPSVEEPVAAPATPEPAAPKDFEGRLGGRIYGWLGGIALALAGIFLVKYSIEQGWLSPGVRIGLGILFGLVLLGVAQWMRTQSNNLGQALTAASVAVLYASLFSATALYDLIPPALAFVTLAALTFAAIALALREGPFVALVAFAGGFLTPLFVSSSEPNLPVLFVFLYLLQLGGLTLLNKRGWWYQAAIANAGGLIWAFVSMVGLIFDHGIVRAYSIPLFIIATSWTAIWAMERGGGAVRSSAMLWTTRGTSIACFLAVAFLLAVTDFTLLNWVFALTLVFSHLVVARLWTAEDVPAYLGTAILIAAFALWPGNSWDYALGAVATRSGEIIGVGLVFGGALLLGGWYFIHGARYPTRWAALSTLGSGFVFGAAYWVLRDQQFLLSWPVLAVALAAIHMGLAQRLDHLRRSDDRYVGAFALHCLAVSGFIAIAIPMQLENAWVPVAWSLELPIIAWVANRLDVAWLRRAIWVGAALILGGIWFSHFPAGDMLVFNWLLYGLGLPMASFIVTAYLLAQTPEQKLRRVLQVLAAALGFGLIGLEVDHFFAHIDVADPEFLAHGVQAIAWLLVALALFPIGDRRRAPVLYDAALVVAGIAGLWLLLFPLFFEHPLFNHIYVGDTAFINRISAIYGLPTLLSLGFAAVLMRRPELGWKGSIGYRVAGVYGLVLGFITVSLLVRQLFHGGYIAISFFSGPTTTDGELYGYSAAWTLYGVALLGLGVKMRSQPLRYASAVVVLLTVLKVGLVDASDLTGLYRVASFLGLGVALIGIGYLYQRILFRVKAE